MGIPFKIHATHALAHGEQHAGEIAIKLLPRLVEQLEGPAGRLQVQLEATRAPGYPMVRGRVQGLLPLACRRCGKSFEWPLDVTLNLRLVRSDDEERNALHDCDPYRVENDELPLHEMVEDEVLLALPMLPRCPACENAVLAAAPAEMPKLEEPRRDNPFAALKKQLKK
ncbi:MAG TPA: YceD family protein [Solimonas sp.]|nr:YceD family protein [Solimonas sp.]